MCMLYEHTERHPAQREARRVSLENALSASRHGGSIPRLELAPQPYRASAMSSMPRMQLDSLA
jgi:hypothetical protein